MGLEVSRLARNSADWHRLLEICALADTLILDEDGIYDPAHFNDRLLLGLKGTMSEAELHLLRARLIGGMMNKARRGELRMRLPIGFAYDGADRVILDPDQQVQQAVRVFFETFRRVGSATATVKEFRRLKLRFPRRVQHGSRKGEILWGELEHHRARWVLHLRVDPDNRLVANSLEADWNEKLRALEHARQCYEQQRKREQLVLDENKREKLLALSTDFPKLWHDIDTPQRERKRMLRLLIEDVTLQRTDQILVHVRFRDGATKTLELGRPLPAWALRQTGTQVVAAVDELIAHHTDNEIADILNERGMRSGEGRALHRLMIRRIRLAYGLKGRYERLREAGYLTGVEIATELGVAVATVKAWRLKGWLQATAYDDKPHYLYAPLGADPPKKYRWKSGRYGESTPDVAKGVQYEA